MYIKLIKPDKKNLSYNITAYNTEDANYNFRCFPDDVNWGCSINGNKNSKSSNSVNSVNETINYGCIGNSDTEYNSNWQIVNFDCTNSNLFPRGSSNFNCQ